MSEVEFEVEFYKKEDGTKPAKDFIFSLEPKMKAKMLDMLQVLEENGNTLREPFSKSLGNGIFELRCKFSSDITRVLYFFYDKGRIIVTNGFVKKTQKTPRKAIDLAEKYRQDFLEREGK